MKQILATIGLFLFATLNVFAADLELDRTDLEQALNDQDLKVEGSTGAYETLGIQKGDVITTENGEAPTSLEAVQEIYAQGAKRGLHIRRGAKKLKVPADPNAEAENADR